MIRQCLALLLADRLNFILVTNHVLQNPWSENWLSVGFSGFLKFSSNFKSQRSQRIVHRIHNQTTLYNSFSNL